MTFFSFLIGMVLHFHTLTHFIVVELQLSFANALQTAEAAAVSGSLSASLTMILVGALQAMQGRGVMQPQNQKDGSIDSNLALNVEVLNLTVSLYSLAYFQFTVFIQYCNTVTSFLFGNLYQKPYQFPVSCVSFVSFKFLMRTIAKSYIITTVNNFSKYSSIIIYI